MSAYEEYLESSPCPVVRFCAVCGGKLVEGHLECYNYDPETEIHLKCESERCDGTVYFWTKDNEPDAFPGESGWSLSWLK